MFLSLVVPMVLQLWGVLIDTKRDVRAAAAASLSAASTLLKDRNVSKQWFVDENSSADTSGEA